MSTTTTTQSTPLAPPPVAPPVPPAPMHQPVVVDPMAAVTTAADALRTSYRAYQTLVTGKETADEAVDEANERAVAARAEAVTAANSLAAGGTTVNTNIDNLVTALNGLRI